MKKNIMIRIDADVAKKAKDLGLNISKVCENSLKQAVEVMEGMYGKREPKIHPISSQKSGLVDWEGFEPPTPAMPRQYSYQLNYQPFHQHV